MRVEMSRISKAVINPYRGSEIPNWQELHLDPNKIYRLLRDPKELEKAADTFSGKPLLMRHVPVTSELPNQALWVGTLGKVTWEDPYLVARPLTVIDAEAQKLIESDEQRELSAGYRYKAVMVPGVFEGEAFDGRMTEIAGNHTALVSAGRAGPDVLVADELPAELKSMRNGKRIARLQKKFPALANLSQSELMALDAELGETPAKPVVTLDEKETKAVCDEALAEKRKTDGEDAELTDEERDAALEKARDKKAKDAKAKDAKRAKDEAEKAAEDEEDDEGDPEDEDDAEDKRAKDSEEKPDHRKDFNSEKEGGADKPAKDKRAKDKRAHDAAMTMDQVNKIVARAVAREASKVRDEVTAQQRALAIACDEVRPLVGQVQLHAFDSAEEVYAYALEKRGVETDDLPPAGYRALVKNELRHIESVRKPVQHALDKDASGFDADALFQRVN